MRSKVNNWDLRFLKFSLLNNQNSEEIIDNEVTFIQQVYMRRICIWYVISL